MNKFKLIGLALAAVMVLSMIACSDGGEDGSDPAHVHDWNDSLEVISTVSETKNGVKAITCKLDRSHTKDEEIEYATGTAGLKIELINTGTNANTYRVSKGTVAAGTVHIPAYYRPDVGSQYVLVTEISIAGANSSSSNAFGGTGTTRDTALTAVTFAAESQLKIIADNAFYNCGSLTSITLPDSITSIGTGAFQGSDLTSITLPAGLTSIGNSAFYECTRLAIITIPANVISIGSNAFSYSGLTAVTFAKESRLNSIDNRAFYNCTSLASITLPAGLTSINDSVFYECTSLTSMTLPDSVTSIATSAFRNCYKLTSITLPAGLKTIGNTAFQQCNALLSITLPASLTSIGNNAFETCAKLDSVTCLPVTPPTLGTTVFAYTSSSLAIKVPPASVDAYKAATGWSTYSARISAMP